MFNKFFGTNTNFDDDSKTNALEDAHSIQKTIDHPIISAAWDEYSKIKQRDDAYDNDLVEKMPTWRGLTKLIKYDGNFKKFKQDEKIFLEALKSGFLIYSDILHVLIDHHNDEEAANELYKNYPELHDLVPQKYDNPLQLIDVIIEVIKDYQWQLEHFSMKHEAAIITALG